MNQREYGKPVVDPFGHREDDHYFMDSVPGYEEENRKNKMRLDFGDRFKKIKEELFLEHQHDEVYSLLDKIENYLKSFVDGISQEMGMNIHDVNGDRHTILISTEFLKDRGFEGNLSDLKNFPSRGAYFLDEFLTILAKYKL